MNPALVISPHLDDAVLSCGQFLAGRPDCTVATVFAGVPENSELLTAYDEKAGFKSSQQAMRRRRIEDKLALAWLRAKPHHLEFLDHGYSDGLNAIDDQVHILSIADVIIAITKRLSPEVIIGPLGVVHPDHKLVGAAMIVVATNVDVPVYLYEDLPYRVTEPRQTQDRFNGLAHITQTTLDFIGDGPLSLKLQALWCYRSQMRLPEFDNPAVFTVPERFWRVSP